MNIKTILLSMGILALAAALLSSSLNLPHKTHIASAKSGAATNDGDSGEDQGCEPDDSPGNEE